VQLCEILMGIVNYKFYIPDFIRYRPVTIHQYQRLWRDAAETFC
jgi:hypothetical protein